MTELTNETRRTSARNPSLLELVETQWRVLIAIMLRDIKTRWVGNHFGFLMSIGLPLSHILILILINTALGRIAPYGDSPALWFATGIIPFMAYSYMARFIMLGIVLNRQMLSFPHVKITDILFARAIVEVLSAAIVILILMAVFSANKIDFIPINPTQAVFALGACMLLGLGFGVVNAIIAAALPMWVTGYALLNIIMWLSSGVFFVANALPEVIRYPLSFNPIVHGIEWMRSAYYEGYGTGYLDKGYLLGCAVFWLCFGLLLERLVRGRLLQ